MNQQDDNCVPYLKRSSQEEEAQGERRQHEQPLRDLDELAAVVPVSKCAGVHREEEKRYPVADDREACQGR